MPKSTRPRRGSLQYWPRKRARRIYPRMKWFGKELKPLGFAGFKAGMTHVQLIDTNPKSHSYGKTITKSATIIDCPPLFVCGLRFYKKDKGLVSIGEIWYDRIPKELELERKTNPAKKKFEIEKFDMEKMENKIDVRLIVATQPKKSGMKKKKPDVFELGLGGDVGRKIDYAKKLLGKEINVKDVFSVGDFLDVSAVTKGHGYTGPVKRFGIRIQTRKDQQSHRHAGSIGSTVPRRVDWRVPLAGQYGFFTRTEFNKRLLMIDDDVKKILPSGGFLNYGIPKSYIVVEGSVPGPRKRLVMLRKAIRAKTRFPVEIKYISLKSMQGGV